MKNNDASPASDSAAVPTELRTLEMPPVPPGAFDVTQSGSCSGALATRSQVTPTPSVPHLPDSRREISPPPGYEITGELGRGGMGIVYAATDLRLKRPVALKMLLQGGDDRRIIRFLIEAEALARVNHPHVVRVFEAGEIAGQPFLALEYLSGGTLAARMAKARPGLLDAVAMMHKIARGVEAAHRQGIIHRDLKPGNVMFDAAGEPKVTDFGLAKHGENELTATEAMMGTPAYMAPEQAKGETKFAGPPADVHALGVMLYELTSGVRPYTGDTSAAIARQVIYDTPVSPRRRDTGIPADIEVITLKCLEKNPAHRYADAGALAADLERWLAGEPILARPAGRAERLLKWSRRKPWQAVAAGLSALTLVGAVAGVVLLQDAYRQTKRSNALLGESNRDLADQKSATEVANERLLKTNEVLAAQKREADNVIAIALDNLEKFTFEVTDKLVDIPKTELIRRNILDEARKSLEALDRLRPKDKAVRKYALVGHDKLAVAENRMGRFKESRESLKNALRLTDELLAENPGENSLRLKKARQHSLLSMLAARLDDPKEESHHLRIAVGLVHDLLKTDPDNQEMLKLSTTTLGRAYARALVDRDAVAAENAIRDYLGVYERLSRLAPEDRSRTMDLIDARLLLSGFFSSHRRPDEALSALETAKKEFEAAPVANDPRSRKLRASLDWTRGNVLSATGRDNEAESSFLEAARGYESLAQDFPRTPDYRATLAQVFWGLGQHWFFLGQLEKARPHLARAGQILDQLLTEHPDDAQNRSVRESVSALEAKLPKPAKK